MAQQTDMRMAALMETLLDDEMVANSAIIWAAAMADCLGELQVVYLVVPLEVSMEFVKVGWTV